MSRAAAGFLTVGAAAKDTTAVIYTNAVANTAAPSGTPGATLDTGTVHCSGWAWLLLDFTVAVNAVEITVRRFSNATGLWSELMSFGFDGVLSLAVGSPGLAVACLGADFIDIQVSDKGVAGDLSLSGTLAQEVAK